MKPVAIAVRTLVDPQAPTSVEELDLSPRGSVHPSPQDWADQALYFLLPDRFSDGKESQRPLYDRSNPTAFKTDDRRAWMKAGTTFQGGTLRGIEGKLDYLKGLGITALWIGPVWKQRADLQTYHGYGIQNFLAVDPRFGTAADLRSLVDAAHARGMYVLLDVIYNHTGNNWFYDGGNNTPRETMPYREGEPHPFHSWRSKDGKPTSTIADPDDGVWPIEFQNPDWYHRAGSIAQWDHPGKEMSSDAEFRMGDFGDLKDLNVENGECLDALVRCYQYWIAVSDCDGFRIDTVKHVPPPISAIFCHEIRTFARKLGKKNFLLLGEVTGSPEVVRGYVDPKGPNLDAVLDIESAPRRLSDFVKGLTPPEEFFAHFGGRDAMGEVRQLGRHHVCVLDDHDMVWRSGKHRFAFENHAADPDAQSAHAVGTQLTTPGIPCIYYGTEQGFTGSESLHDHEAEPCCEGRVPSADRYVREAMFGSPFGAFLTTGCHFFDPAHPAYRRIAAIAKLRSGDDSVGLALRRGQLFVRETRHPDKPDEPFHPPAQGEIVAWSRLHEGSAVIVALNTHGLEPRSAEVTIDADLHPVGSTVKVLYRGDWTDEQLANPPADQAVEVKRDDTGRATIRVDLPAGGMAIFQ
jgi:glycosidase